MWVRYCVDNILCIYRFKQFKRHNTADLTTHVNGFSINQTVACDSNDMKRTSRVHLNANSQIALYVHIFRNTFLAGNAQNVVAFWARMN